MEKHTELTKNDVNKIDEMVERWIKIMEQCNNIKLQYDLESIKKIDNYIEECRILGNNDFFETTTIMIGYFFGKCIIKEYGGTWIIPEEYRWPHLMIDESIFNPLGKVRKQFKNGAEDSVEGYFHFIRFMLKNREAVTDGLKKDDKHILWHDKLNPENSPILIVEKKKEDNTSEQSVG